MTRRVPVPTRLARAVVAWSARVCARDARLLSVWDNAGSAEDQRLWTKAAAAGEQIAATWPAGAHPDIDLLTWSDNEFVLLADGMDPEQIEGHRRYDTDRPRPDCLNVYGAAAEAARLIPDPHDSHASADVPLARVLLTVLLHAAAHNHRDTHDVHTWAADLTGEGLHTIHTALHDSGAVAGPALAVLAVARSLPAPTLARAGALITTALTPATTTTGRQRP